MTSNSLTHIYSTQLYSEKFGVPFLEEKHIPKPDVIIADPPRAGMNPKTDQDILTLESEKIVYVSCNPASQAEILRYCVKRNIN